MGPSRPLLGPFASLRRIVGTTFPFLYLAEDIVGEKYANIVVYLKHHCRATVFFFIVPPLLSDNREAVVVTITRGSGHYNKGKCMIQR